MNYNHIISELQNNIDVFHSLLHGLDTDLQIWKPAPPKWSLLEIVCHLYDEERDDFRYRLRHILDTPQAAMPSINPVEWVISRHYDKQNYEDKLLAFRNERLNSIAWLNTLEDAPWDNTHQHPSIGPMSADMILANWLAHDYLHIRQITSLKYQYLQQTTNVNLKYAGNW